MTHPRVPDHSQPAIGVDPAEETISPTESDVAVFAAAMRRTAEQLADARQSKPEFAHEMNDLLIEAEKHATDLNLPGVAKGLRPNS